MNDDLPLMFCNCGMLAEDYFPFSRFPYWFLDFLRHHCYTSCNSNEIFDLGSSTENVKL